MSNLLIDKPDDDLRSLARDWVERRVLFGSQVPENILMHVFMPLIFMNDEMTKNTISADNFGDCYGRMEDAGPRSINGCPIFSKISFINKSDLDKVLVFIEEYQKLTESFSKGTAT